MVRFLNAALFAFSLSSSPCFSHVSIFDFLCSCRPCFAPPLQGRARRDSCSSRLFGCCRGCGCREHLGEGLGGCPGASLFSSSFMFADFLQDELGQFPMFTGVQTDAGLVALVRDAHNALIRFATREWAIIAPWVMLDTELCGLVGSLPEGTTLAEAIPEAFGASAPPADVAAPSSVPPVVIAPPSAPPSAASVRVPTLSLDISSRLRGQPLVLVPPSRASSRSPATASPAQTTPSPVVPPVSSQPPSAGSGADAALPSTPGSGPSPSIAVPPAGPSHVVRERPISPAAPVVGKSGRVSAVLFTPSACFKTLFLVRAL